MFRTSTHLYAVVGLMAVPLLSIALAAGIMRGSWLGTAILLSCIALLFTFLATSRFEIHHDHFGQRTLLHQRWIGFDQVADFDFETSGILSLTLKTGEKVAFFMRRFDSRAAQSLLGEFEAKSITPQSAC